jgi:hypothetical protein
LCKILHVLHKRAYSVFAPTASPPRDGVMVQYGKVTALCNLPRNFSETETSPIKHYTIAATIVGPTALGFSA